MQIHLKQDWMMTSFNKNLDWNNSNPYCLKQVIDINEFQNEPF